MCDAFGIDSEEALLAKGMLGTCFFEWGDYGRALSLLAEAVEKCKMKLGERHERTLVVMAQHSQVLAELGRHKEA